jgi:hypothetical protein
MKFKTLATVGAALFSAVVLAQNPELQARIDDFIASHNTSHEKKYLNITMPDVGNIKGTFPQHVTEFMLRGKEKMTNTLDQEVKERVFIAFYEYETPEDTRYALSSWMKNFIDGKVVKPGREMKRFPGARPMYVLIDEQWIAFLTIDCTEWDKKRWEAWVASFDKAFSNNYTRTMELLCEGPLTWPRNPPDPKTFR